MGRCAINDMAKITLKDAPKIPGTNLKEGTLYCPICGRNIAAANLSEVQNGKQVTYLYYHDALLHTNEDLVAMSSGIH